jgi:hypothetical protein
VSAAADDRFAQLDVVGLTIALATKRSPGPGPTGGARGHRDEKDSRRCAVGDARFGEQLRKSFAGSAGQAHDV